MTDNPLFDQVRSIVNKADDDFMSVKFVKDMNELLSKFTTELGEYLGNYIINEDCPDALREHIVEHFTEDMKISLDLPFWTGLLRILSIVIAMNEEVDDSI
jgi:hypothetical protein